MLSSEKKTTVLVLKDCVCVCVTARDGLASLQVLWSTEAASSSEKLDPRNLPTVFTQHVSSWDLNQRVCLTHSAAASDWTGEFASTHTQTVRQLLAQSPATIHRDDLCKVKLCFTNLHSLHVIKREREMRLPAVHFWQLGSETGIRVNHHTHQLKLQWNVTKERHHW